MSGSPRKVFAGVRREAERLRIAMHDQAFIWVTNLLVR